MTEWDSLVAQRQQVLATRSELHKQIRNKTPSQSVIERAHLRVRSHRLGQEAQELDTRMQGCRDREKVMIKELEELDHEIDEIEEVSRGVEGKGT